MKGNSPKTTAGAIAVPSTGLKGFKENWRDDLLSGFQVSLIALPLSLGIAGASNFPPLMGLITAIVGGLIVTFFAKSALAIKGPAAGLIVVISSAVSELGRGDATLGWHLSVAAIIVVGFLQMIFGAFELSKLTDFVPLAAVQGMLAGMGVIIMAKQIHLAMGIMPLELAGKSPIELIGMIPGSLLHMEYHIAIIGLIGLMIMFGWRFLFFSFLKKTPPALIVLVAGIGLGQFFHLFEFRYSELRPLLDPGYFSLSYAPSFGKVDLAILPVFLKYVVMLAIAGSLETVHNSRAVDLVDPYHRMSDGDTELKVTGAGNMIVGLIGGLPMISAMVISAANSKNGAKTKWSGLFQAICLLTALLTTMTVIRMIPVATLATILIYAGFKLASPAEIRNIYEIGKEQFITFLVTMLVTILTNLLWGIAAGMLAKSVVQLVYGVKFSQLLAPKIKIDSEGEVAYIGTERSVVFNDSATILTKLENVEPAKNIKVDFSEASDIDNLVIENIIRFKGTYEQSGGRIELIGFGNYQVLPGYAPGTIKNQCLTVIS